jgi:hypothetical protein
MGTDAALQLPLRKVHDVLKLSNSCVPFQHMILMVESCPMPFCRFAVLAVRELFFYGTSTTY